MSRVVAQANLRMVRVSPQKMNLVAARIRGMSAQAALDYLAVCPKRVAVDVRKAVLSAMANAENNHGMDVSSLEIVESYVGKGTCLRRFRARAKGRGAGIRKMFSHLCIKVAEKVVEPSSKVAKAKKSAKPNGVASDESKAEGQKVEE